MARFQLDPNETAMENLWRAARMATAVIARSHNFWHLWGEYKDEAFERLVLASVEAFMRLKIRGGGYCRYTKDGSKKLTFFDNMLSACYGCSSHIINQYMQELKERNSLDDIEPMKFCLSYADKLPLYRSRTESQSKLGVYNKGITELSLPRQRADRARELYDEYLEECKMMGISNILDFDHWLCRMGYNKDTEMMMALEPPRVRRALLAARRKIEKDSKIPAWDLHRTLYMREWARNRWNRKLLEMSRQLEALYGPPPDGCIWRDRKGKIGIQRIKG